MSVVSYLSPGEININTCRISLSKALKVDVPPKPIPLYLVQQCSSPVPQCWNRTTVPSNLVIWVKLWFSISLNSGISSQLAILMNSIALSKTAKTNRVNGVLTISKVSTTFRINTWRAGPKRCFSAQSCGEVIFSWSLAVFVEGHWSLHADWSCGWSF